MKTEIQIDNSDNNTIAWDKVSVWDGIYGSEMPEALKAHFFVTVKDNGFRFAYSNGLIGNDIYQNLWCMINAHPTYQFFTISGLRITPESKITVDSLCNDDFVAWIDNYGGKFFVIKNLDTTVNAICYNHPKFIPPYQLARSVKSFNISELVKGCIIVNIYKFDTAQELYKWLAE
jgi:hypothetical protein